MLRESFYSGIAGKQTKTAVSSGLHWPSDQCKCTGSGTGRLYRLPQCSGAPAGCHREAASEIRAVRAAPASGRCMNMMADGYVPGSRWWRNPRSGQGNPWAGPYFVPQCLAQRRILASLLCHQWRKIHAISKSTNLMCSGSAQAVPHGPYE